MAEPVRLRAALVHAAEIGHRELFQVGLQIQGDHQRSREILQEHQCSNLTHEERRSYVAESVPGGACQMRVGLELHRQSPVQVPETRAVHPGPGRKGQPVQALSLPHDGSEGSQHRRAQEIMPEAQVQK